MKRLAAEIVLGALIAGAACIIGATYGAAFVAQTWIRSLEVDLLAKSPRL